MTSYGFEWRERERIKDQCSFAFEGDKPTAKLEDFLFLSSFFFIHNQRKKRKIENKSFLAKKKSEMITYFINKRLAFIGFKETKRNYGGSYFATLFLFQPLLCWFIIFYLSLPRS